MTEHPKFAVFTYEQLEAASNEIALHSWNPLSKDEVWRILCKWTKQLPSDCVDQTESKK